jgi:hypothetical protein
MRTMTRLASLAGVLAFAAIAMGSSSLLAADEKIDVTGTWDVEIEIAGQQGMPVFTFKQEGDQLTGSYKGQFGEAPVTGKLDGNKIEFKFETQGVQIVYTGEVDKDTMKGKADYAGQATGDWKAKKKPAK